MIIGIDLGTTNSCVAAVINGKAQVIPNLEGEMTTPSVISFMDNGDSATGNRAKRRRVSKPLDTVSSVKRFMGRKYTSVKDEFERLPYSFTCDADDNICVAIHGRRMTIPEVSSHVLAKLRSDVSKRLGTNITEAVITVPAYFNDAQREATREAGRLAGLDVRKIISEPTAAALAYGKDAEDQTIAVYDLGGGTFDISILRIENGSFRVLYTNGNTMLGGDDIDRRISDWIIRKGLEKTGEDLAEAFSNPVTRNGAAYAMQAVRDAAEKAKIELSSEEETVIDIPVYYNGTSLMGVKLTRKNLANMISYVTDQTFKCCDKAMEAAGNPKLDAVVLVGGSTKSPCVREAVAEYFHTECDTSVNPDEAVALGAAIQADMLERNDNTLRDVTPMDLGILTMDNGGYKKVIATIVKANTQIPAKYRMRFRPTKNSTSDRLDFPVMQGAGRIGSFSVNAKKNDVVDIVFSIDHDGILTVTASNGNSEVEFTKKHAV